MSPQTNPFRLNPPFRIDHVGSFLRPQEVLDARRRVKAGQASEAELRAVEDRYIAQIVQEQIACGIRGITDGEFRRLYFHLDFLEKLSGVSVVKSDLDKSDEDFRPPKLAVTGPLRHVAPIQVADFLYLKSQIDPRSGAIPKVCIPSPTMVHFRGGRASIDITAYPSLDLFFFDLANAYRAEISALYRAGCRYLQLDDTNLAYLCDPAMREEATARGEDVNTLPRRYCALINECLRDVPKDMTVAVHLCRGNFRSLFFAQGGYEPVAEVLFRELNVNAYFLEWDDHRSGEFKPLRFLPANKVVVLGLISTKFGELEDKARIIGRIKEAAQYAPLGIRQLALSPQCGFSSTAHGNNITPEDQWKKMRLIREIVEEVWGSG